MSTLPQAPGAPAALTPGDTSASLFDAFAERYDEDFTHTLLGGVHRDAVMRRLLARFRAGHAVLELGCGTGEDAVHLARQGIRVVATDPSEAMVRVASRKVSDAGLDALVTVERLPAEELSGSSPVSPDRPFDGAFSNFGALNCVAELDLVANGLASCLRSGAPVLLCLMGPVCLWEWAWYGFRGQPGKAFRRLRRGGVSWRGATIRYPSIGTVRRAFAPEFRLQRVAAIGALVPPPYAEAWATRRPRTIERLARLERRCETVPPLPWLSDHYLLELQRK